ncbi:FtsX-like permease family protein [Paenibacillus yanchengensis]|uniref:FtsX-like permease family protein n=1 Tax=Paenibacillus yanchengensis TaxID=2035833 RepID=A0ABW4YQ22_9BACL
MTFRSLAISNIKGNWRSYSAYFLSSVFSVAIFYLYAAFIYHPGIVNGHIIGASGVKTAMELCLYLIIIFSFFFVLYSNSAFLKTRKKEFGLYSLFGMTRNQLRKMVIYENTAISLLAIATGIGIGMLFSKLFFMTISALLQMEQSMPFAMPSRAIWITAIGFFSLFFFLSIWSSFRIGKVEIIELLQAGQRPKGELVYSKWLVLVAVVCLAASYSMAYIMDGFSFILLSLPILITVVIGTYFLLTQLSIFLLKLAKRKPSFYYKRTNLLTYAQLGYKIRDNARILFTVSILSAVIMTAMSTVYIMSIQMRDDALEIYPHTMSFAAPSQQIEQLLDEKQLEEKIAAANIEVAFKDKYSGILLDNSTIELQMMNKKGVNKPFHWDQSISFIIAESDYNNLAQHLKLPKTSLHDGELVFIGSSYEYIDHSFKQGTFQSTIESQIWNVDIVQWIDGNIMNKTLPYVGYTLVANDEMFQQLSRNTNKEQTITVIGYELKNWTKTTSFMNELKADLTPEQLEISSIGRLAAYNEANTISGLTLFIGLFISLLFFLAAGSMIYFKLFTELSEDRSHFRSLHRIGMTKAETKRIVVSQIAIIFFVPCVIGIVHALFAMQSLDNIMMSSNWLYSFVIIGIFILMQYIYFLAASRSYMKGLMRSEG